mmetsp:Transcript_3645/g.8123  ORF Transcript_3645/g.8123 Transcript_3645/m.8123 type:complete len:129 (+) Transcript_3645:929-1315(+)
MAVTLRKFIIIIIMVLLNGALFETTAIFVSKIILSPNPLQGYQKIGTIPPAPRNAIETCPNCIEPCSTAEASRAHEPDSLMGFSVAMFVMRMGGCCRLCELGVHSLGSFFFRWQGAVSRILSLLSRLQ